ncbi:mycofactocin-associated electron transfer flavoprotein beta subunit [Saccharopolyspora griseoalba]|uniref:Mycofactocin-associated electron transfer flavoprotein beta subunit n=1 Tax=Saccharopolyspora griseoalba TaxID=1431848 RepID=A0ABW2LMC3_9PSEU
MGPQIVVALSHSHHRVEVDPLTARLSDGHRGPSPAEHAALEHALRLGEHFDGQVLVVTAGPPEAEQRLREALAAGADRAVRVDHDPPLAADAVARNGSETARALLSALPGTPDLVLCGDRSADGGTGSTPGFLAAALGAEQALGSVRLEADGSSLLAHRRLDGGSREVLRVRWPAVVSVEGGLRLRRASLPAVLAAREAVIPVVEHRAGGGSEAVVSARPRRPRPRALPAPSGTRPHDRVLELTGALTERTPPRVVGPLSASEAADELLAFLQTRGYRAEPR